MRQLLSTSNTAAHLLLILKPTGLAVGSILLSLGCAGTAAPVVEVPVPKTPEETVAVGTSAEVFLIGRQDQQLIAGRVTKAGEDCQGSPSASPDATGCEVLVTYSGLRVLRDQHGTHFGRTIGLKPPTLARVSGGTLSASFDEQLFVAKPPSGPFRKFSTLPAKVKSLTAGKVALMMLDNVGGVWRSVDAGLTWTASTVGRPSPTAIGLLRPIAPTVGSLGLDSAGNGIILESPTNLRATHDDGATFEPMPHPEDFGAPTRVVGIADGVVLDGPAAKLWSRGSLSKYSFPSSAEGLGLVDQEFADVASFAPIGPALLIVRKTEKDGESTYYSELRSPRGALPKREEKSLADCASVFVTNVAPVGRYSEVDSLEATITCEVKLGAGIYRLYTASAKAAGLSELVERLSIKIKTRKPDGVVLPAGEGLWISDIGCESDGCTDWQILDGHTIREIPALGAKLEHVVRTADGIWVVGRKDGTLVIRRLSSSGGAIVGTETTSKIGMLDAGGYLAVKTPPRSVSKNRVLAARAVGENLELFFSGEPATKLTARLVDEAGVPNIQLSEDKRSDGLTIVAFAGNRAFAQSHSKWFESKDGGETFVEVSSSLGDVTRCSSGGCIGNHFARLGWESPEKSVPIAAVPKSVVPRPAPLYCNEVGPKSTFAGYPVGLPSIVSACGKSPLFSGKGLRLTVPLGRYASPADVAAYPAAALFQEASGKLHAKFESFLGPVVAAKLGSSDPMAWANADVVGGARYSFNRIGFGGTKPVTLEIEVLNVATGRRVRTTSDIGTIRIARSVRVSNMQRSHWLQTTKTGFALVSSYRYTSVGLFAGTLRWSPFSHGIPNLSLGVSSSPFTLSHEGGLLSSRRFVTKEVEDEPAADGLLRFADGTLFAAPKDTLVAAFDRLEDHSEIGFYEVTTAGSFRSRKVEISTELPACGPCATELVGLTLPAEPIAIDAFGISTVDNQGEKVLGLESADLDRERVCSLGKRLVQPGGAGFRRWAVVEPNGNGIMYQIAGSAKTGSVSTRAELSVVAVSCGGALPAGFKVSKPVLGSDIDGAQDDLRLPDPDSSSTRRPRRGDFE